jgi:hypothetical protein
LAAAASIRRHHQKNNESGGIIIMKINQTVSPVLLCAAAFFWFGQILPAQTSVVNGNFETSTDGITPDAWSLLGSQPPTWINADSHSPTHCMSIAVSNVDLSAQKAELDQNTLNAGGGAVNPGDVYNFSFWAKSLSSGVSYVQQYNLQWLDTNSAIVGQLGFANIPGAPGVWTQINVTNLAAPAAAATALIQIFGATGAVGTSGYGAVLIDDVSLTVAAPPQTNPVAASIQSGIVLGWTSTNGALDQVQSSANPGGPWANLGGPLAGVSGAASAFETNPGPYYRVLQTIGSGGNGNLVQNPSFEISANNAIGASNWNINANASSIVTVTNASTPGPFDGSRDLYMEGSVPAGGGPAPNSDVRSDFIPVTPGAAYSLSFYAANPVKIGGANPQYDIFFYNTNNNPVGGPIFTSFASAGASWTQFTNTVTPPAGATKLTIGWIQAVGAGAGFDWVTLIDDVSLSSGGGGSSSQTNVVSTSSQRGVQISWASVNGASYQVESTGSLSTNPAWSTFGGIVTGNGSTNTAVDPASSPEKFYKVLQLP